MSRWLVGDVAQLFTEITDPAGQPVDPPSLQLSIKPPSGVTQIVTYPGDIVRTAVGKYQFDAILTVSGKVKWRWLSAAPYQGATQGELLVLPSNI